VSAPRDNQRMFRCRIPLVNLLNFLPLSRRNSRGPHRLDNRHQFRLHRYLLAHLRVRHLSPLGCPQVDLPSLPQLLCVHYC
jgi:hypothetical protein